MKLFRAGKPLGAWTARLAHRMLGDEAKRFWRDVDIHGGGIDLVFPHHENEIAQSESAHAGRALARVWLHNGFPECRRREMSKSLGNFVTIRELLADWPGDVLRLNMLRTHYRQPSTGRARMNESWTILERWYEGAEPVASRRMGEPFSTRCSIDLNTPQAIAELHRAEPEELAGRAGAIGVFPPIPDALLRGLPYPLRKSRTTSRPATLFAKHAISRKPIVSARTWRRRAFSSKTTPTARRVGK